MGFFVIKFTKTEIEMDGALKKKIEFICGFAKAKPTFINGNVISINRTNLTYVEPHRIVIKGIIFLAFNYSNELYINNLNEKLEFKDLEAFLKNA